MLMTVWKRGFVAPQLGVEGEVEVEVEAEVEAGQ